MQPFVSRFQALKALLITVIAYEEDTEKKTKETTTWVALFRFRFCYHILDLQSSILQSTYTKLLSRHFFCQTSTTLTMPTLRNKHNVAFKSISILREEDICLEQFINGTWYNMHNTYTMHIFYSNLSLLSQKNLFISEENRDGNKFFCSLWLCWLNIHFERLKFDIFVGFSYRDSMKSTTNLLRE